MTLYTDVCGLRRESQTGTDGPARDATAAIPFSASHGVRYKNRHVRSREPFSSPRFVCVVPFAI